MPDSTSRGPHCPMCRKAVPDDAASFPFCCDHCRKLDLGNWLDGRYRVAVETEDAHDLESMDEAALAELIMATKGQPQ